MPDDVLIIANSMIGDVILTTGVIDEIVRRNPGARFTIVCSPGTRLLFRNLPADAEVIPLAKQKRGGHWIELYRRLGGRRWAAIHDFRGTVFSWFLRGPKSRPSRWKGEIPRHKALEAASILGPKQPAMAPIIWLTPSDSIDLPDEVAQAPGPILVLGPGASRRGKAWPADRFLDVAQALATGSMKDALVVAVGGPMDKEAARIIGAGLPPERYVDLTGADLLTTSAVMARADLFIGNDSGMMHLAAASGAPTLGLFGPTDERLYGPWGQRAATVRPEGVAFVFGKTSKTVSRDQSQMGALTVQAVTLAAEQLLSAKN